MTDSEPRFPQMESGEVGQMSCLRCLHRSCVADANYQGPLFLLEKGKLRPNLAFNGKVPADWHSFRLLL